MNIGIIGYGYVGKAVAESYAGHKIYINDPKYIDHKDYYDFSIIHSVCDAIFVCVPTPSDAVGKCNTEILANTLDALRSTRAMVISKSTAPPDFYQMYEKRVDYDLAHVPEFLTQARANYDYVNPHKVVIGAKLAVAKRTESILESSAINFDEVVVEHCSIAEASFFKYMANCQLAIKVIVNNEFSRLAEQMHLDWENIAKLAKSDRRLGHTHWRVPGPDGEPGFGGACFPKDTAAVLELGNKYSTQLTVLEQAVKTNQKIRP